MKIWISAFCLIGLLATAGGTSADAAKGELAIGGLDIPGVFSMAEAGPYRDLYALLAADAPVSMALHLMPIKRANRAFFGHEVDCLYMASNDEDYYQANGHSYDEFVGSLPFNHIYMRAYTPEAKPLLESLADLKATVLASDIGMQQSTIAQRLLPAGQRILYARTLNEAFDLVDSGRAGAVLAYDFDVQRHLRRSKRGDYHASSMFSLVTLTEQFVCWPSDKARSFVRYLDGRISALKVSGALRAEFGFSP